MPTRPPPRAKAGGRKERRGNRHFDEEPTSSKGPGRHQPRSNRHPDTTATPSEGGGRHQPRSNRHADEGRHPRLFRTNHKALSQSRRRPQQRIAQPMGCSQQRLMAPAIFSAPARPSSPSASPEYLDHDNTTTTVWQLDVTQSIHNPETGRGRLYLLRT
jgi:hypothetical protein